MDLILIVHAAVTCFLCGVIWMVQTVHYPLFERVSPDAFVVYEREHQTRIARLVAPAMVAEVVLAVVLLLRPPGGAPTWMPAVGGALVAWIWISTVVLAVPRHRILERGFRVDAHRALLSANWHRTAAWSARAMLALWMMRPWGEGT